MKIDNERTEADLIRDALFLAASRTYGEQYIEPLVRHKLHLFEADGDDYDAEASDGISYEIKASKVMRQKPRSKGSESILERIKNELPRSPLTRYFDSSKRFIENYGANIQNVKRDHFDKLIYVLLFKDCIRVYSADVSTISHKGLPGWSDKHGRYDEEGKSGQFNINNSRIKWHDSNNFLLEMSYEEAVEIYRQIGVE
jgi:hypothetical protein